MTQSPAPPHHRRRTWLLHAGLAAAVAGAVLVAHWPALSARAVCFDDQEYLLYNSLVQHPSWTSTRRFLTEILEPSSVQGYYQPLAMISLMLDYAAGGRPDELEPFHRTSLALHVANSLLVMALLSQLFGHPVVAALVALLFGVHPLTVEPIPWVGERKTLLAAFFSLWSLLLYVRYTRQPTRARHAACLGLYGLALLSKPTATTLPFVMLLLDWWPLGRLNRRALVEKLPFFVAAGVSAVVTFESQRRTAVTLLPTEYPAARSLLIICHNIIFYLHKIVWPADLSPHYPMPESVTLADPAVSAGVIGTIALAAVLVLSLRWTRALLAGWLIFFVALFPTMGVIGFTSVIASDKFVYIPAVGFLLILAWALTHVWDAARPAPCRIALAVVAALALTAEVRATRGCLAHWRDSDTLSRHIVALAPGSARAHYLRAEALDEQGQLDEAIGHYREAVRLWPDFADAHHNLGASLATQGALDEAIAHYIVALQLYPAPSPEAHYDLATALALQGKLDAAIGQFDETLRLKPDFPEAHYNLAVALAQQGKLAQSVAHLREALRLRPTFPEAQDSLATLLAAPGTPRDD